MLLGESPPPTASGGGTLDSMHYEMRPIVRDELAEFMALESENFGGDPPDAVQLERDQTEFELARSLGVFDDGALVATAGAISFELTLPGGRMLPAAGIACVTVAPTHRRRGILTSMMGRLLDDALARGEALAILHPSESQIYGRFGYGLATSEAALAIETRHARLASPAEAEGAIVALRGERAAEVLPALYDQARRGIVGATSRSAAYWRNWLSYQASASDGWSTGRLVACRGADGTYQGYLAYRIKRHWQDAMPAHTARVGDLFALTQQARTALWRFCLSLDLVTRVEVPYGPVEEPLRWQLADPRRLQVTRLSDALWLRVLDVPAALCGRGYQVAGDLVLAVDDSFRTALTRSYRLVCGPDGATCERIDRAADLALSAADLGAVYLGGVTPSTLARAGRVRELRPGALALADAIFSAEMLPWATTHF